MDWLNGMDVNLMNKNLDGLWQRQRVISENLANSETPGYRSKRVAFEDTLKDTLALKGRENRAQKVLESPIEIGESEGAALRADGNNVDAEAENIEMARTQLAYMYSLQSVSDHFARLKIAITGSR